MCYVMLFVKIYILTQRTEELENDRNRIQLALDQTEASLIGYMEEAQQQEPSLKMESKPHQVSLSVSSASLRKQTAPATS